MPNVPSACAPSWFLVSALLLRRLSVVVWYQSDVSDDLPVCRASWNECMLSLPLHCHSQCAMDSSLIDVQGVHCQAKLCHQPVYCHREKKGL